MSNRKTLNERIEAAKMEKEQAEARIKQLQRQQKAAERKARDHRLCRRGEKLESCMPRLILLNDEQFELWMKKALLSGHAERYLNEILNLSAAETEDGTDTAQNDGNAVTMSAPMAARTESNTALKPAQAAKQSSGADRGKTAEALRVTD